MQKRKIKTAEITTKLLNGIKIGRQKMLEEKSIKNDFVVYYDNGKIKRERAREILKKEEKVK